MNSDEYSRLWEMIRERHGAGDSIVRLVTFVRTASDAIVADRRM